LKNVANIKRITLVKTFGHYKAGDGLQLEEKEATTLVDAGFAVFSEK
jgi:hypothetical protein